MRWRALAWFREWMLWRVFRALRGHRLSVGTQQDFDSERIADRIKKWARRSAYWLLVPTISVKLYTVGERLLGSTTDLDGVLRSVLTAASLTSGLLAAGLMNATSQSKELRRRRVDELRECQKQLQPIQRAFDSLVVDLQNREPKGEALSYFVDQLRRVSDGWYEYGEVYGHGKLIAVDKILDIKNALERLSGMLGRPKHFRHLVHELSGRPASEVNSLEGVVLTQWDGVKYALGRFRPQTDNVWKTLSFWEDLINETLELVVRTAKLSVEVHYHNLTQVRVMFAHLAWLMVVGVGVPLVTLTFPALQRHKAGLLMVAVGGLLLVLTSSLVMLYRWIVQRRLHDEGTLEV